jgi:hypothetical protein
VTTTQAESALGEVEQPESPLCVIMCGHSNAEIGCVMLELAASQNIPDGGIGLVPPRRMAHLLLRARAAAGFTRDEVASRSSGRFTADELGETELGARLLNDEEVRFLAELLGLSVGQLFPRRAELVLDRQNNRIGTTDRWAYLPPFADSDELLRRYLALVYVLRGVKPGRFIVPRSADLAVLADVTESSGGDVRLRLEKFIRAGRDDISLLAAAFGQRVVVNGLGVLVGKTPKGELILSDNDAYATAARA